MSEQTVQPSLGLQRTNVLRTIMIQDVAECVCNLDYSLEMHSAIFPSLDLLQ